MSGVAVMIQIFNIACVCIGSALLAVVVASASFPPTGDA